MIQWSPMMLSLGGNQNWNFSFDEIISNLTTASASTPVSRFVQNPDSHKKLRTFCESLRKHPDSQKRIIFCGCKDAIYTKNKNILFCAIFVRCKDLILSTWYQSRARVSFSVPYPTWSKRREACGYPYPHPDRSVRGVPADFFRVRVRVSQIRAVRV